MTTCLYCQHDNPAEQSVCENCGMNLPQHTVRLKALRLLRFKLFVIVLSILSDPTRPTRTLRLLRSIEISPSLVYYLASD